MIARGQLLLLYLYTCTLKPEIERNIHTTGYFIVYSPGKKVSNQHVVLEIYILNGSVMTFAFIKVISRV